MVMALNVTAEIASIKSTLGALEAKIHAETEERKNEGAEMLRAIDAINKTLKQESLDHMTEFHEVKQMYSDLKEGSGAISVELQKQKAGTHEFLVAVNSMKAALDLEQSEHVNKYKEFQSWKDDAKASVDEVKSECLKQQQANEDLMRVLNSLKTVVDKEAQERIDNGTKIDRHIKDTEGIRTSVMTQIDSQRSSTDELLRVINTLKDAFDREQHEGVVKHSEMLKCIEETHSTVAESFPVAGNKDVVERLRRLRIDTNNNLGHPEDSTHTKKPPSPIPAHRSNSFDLGEVPRQHQQGQVGTPPIADVGSPIDKDVLKEEVMKEVAQISINNDLLKEAVVQEVAQSTKKTMEAMEQERKDREERYLLLHSQLANFQYDFAVERKERTQLHGELISLKSELQKKVDSLSQEMISEMRAIQFGERQALQKPAVAPQVDSEVLRLEVARVFSEEWPNQQEMVKREVARVFSEELPNQKEWTIQVESALSQGAIGISNIERKIAELALELSARIDAMESVAMDKSASEEDLISRAELKEQVRRISELSSLTFAQDKNTMPREEFEDHLQRLWQAIMQLQAKQLEELREKTREAAFNNGTAGQARSSGSPRRLLSNSKPSILAPSSSPASNALLQADKSSPSSRRSGASPYRNASGRSMAGSGQPTPRSAGSANIYTTPTALLNDNLIPTPQTTSDAMTPNTSVGARTPGVPGVSQYRNQR